MAQKKVVLAAIGIILTIFFIQKIIQKRRYKLPPTVKGWPVAGSIPDMPNPANMWIVEAGKKYGEM